MKIIPIPDEPNGFNLVELKSDNGCKESPHCKLHGAMLKVSESGMWRCIRGKKQERFNTTIDCRAGCKELHENKERSD